MVIIILATLVYLVNAIKRLDGPLTARALVVDLLAGLAILWLVLCLFGVALPLRCLTVAVP